MISVFEALSIIDQNVCSAGVSRVSLAESLGCTLSEAIYAPINLPPFRQSSMDGYAFRFGDQKELEVIGECKAGDFKEFDLKEDQAVRIFTGARVPTLADTVIMQEHVSKTEGGILIQKHPSSGANVRPVGEQVKENTLVLEAGTKVNPAVIGFLAGLGMERISVFSKPQISLIITGNELQPPGRPLQPGSVYESNALTLTSALATYGLDVAKILRVPDHKEATGEAIHQALSSDVVLISGGISVGDYDFVKEGLESNKVTEKFYKVNQKPGKPLWFGKKGNKLVFALPGNPASSLTCLLMYVVPAIQKMMSGKSLEVIFQTGTSKNPIENQTNKTLLLQGKETGGVVEVYEKQASSMLVSFAQSNAILMIPENEKSISAGEEVQYIPINRF